MKRLNKEILLLIPVILLSFFAINIYKSEAESDLVKSKFESVTVEKNGIKITYLDHLLNYPKAVFIYEKKGYKPIVRRKSDVIISSALVSNTIYITSPGATNDIRANFNTAVSSANDGDIVVVPNGSFTVTQTVTITKKIKVTGGGIGVSILYRDESVSDATLSGWGPMITFNINDDKPSGIEFAKLELRSQIPLITAGDGGSLASDVGLKFINAVDFLVHDCKFMYFGNGGIDVRHRDYLARGVIYNCKFYRNAKGTDGLGLGYGVVVYGEANKWYSNTQLGSSNFIFIEDCRFDYHRHSIACAGCSRYVARYDSVMYNIVSPPYSHAIDTHQDRELTSGTNRFGARATEVYNNWIINPTRIDGTTAMANGCPDNQIEERAIGCGNGDMVVHDNYISGFRFAIGGYQGESNTYRYPYLHQVGWASGKQYGRNHTGTDGSKGDGDLFYWSNTFTTFTLTGGGACQLFWNYTASGGNGTSSNYLMLERDYHPSAKPGYVPYTYPHPLRAKAIL